MSKFKYYKIVKNGVTTELHLEEQRGECVVAKIYPKLQQEGKSYKDENIKELENLDKWREEGLNTSIFTNSSFEPKHS